MPWIDAHLDLAYLALLGRDLRSPCPDPATGCVSLPALREAGLELVMVTIFTEPAAGRLWKPHFYPDHTDRAACEAAGRRQLEVYQRLEDEGQLSIVRVAADLRASGPRPLVILLMEGADPIRSPNALQWWFDHGLRAVGLTWAAGSRYAGGNSAPGPLTSEGRDLIAALDNLGLMHDLSHLADAALEGVLRHARGPVMASHSNCRALLDGGQRHLADHDLHRIALRGGLVGLNLYGRFLATGRAATIADAARHVEHAAAIMGHRRGVGLGSDMDGGFPPSDLPQGLDHPARLPALARELHARGWNDADLAGFRHDNWMRFFEQALPR
jgi:membrane dipeptidase